MEDGGFGGVVRWGDNEGVEEQLGVWETCSSGAGGTRRGWLGETQGEGFSFIQVGFVGQVGRKGAWRQAGGLGDEAESTSEWEGERQARREIDSGGISLNLPAGPGAVCPPGWTRAWLSQVTAGDGSSTKTSLSSSLKWG